MYLSVKIFSLQTKAPERVICPFGADETSYFLLEDPFVVNSTQDFLPFLHIGLF